jgi:hypothetical protein
MHWVLGCRWAWAPSPITHVGSAPLPRVWCCHSQLSTQASCKATKKNKIT